MPPKRKTQQVNLTCEQPQENQPKTKLVSTASSPQDPNSNPYSSCSSSSVPPTGACPTHGGPQGPRPQASGPQLNNH